MQTYEYPIEEPVKCGGCNWETSRLYVEADTREEADRMLHVLWGCTTCGKLEWEHATFLGFHGTDRETAAAFYSDGVPGACAEFSPNADAMDGAGMCGECFAAMMAERAKPGLKELLDALDHIDESHCPCAHPEMYGHLADCECGIAETALMNLRLRLRVGVTQ